MDILIFLTGFTLPNTSTDAYTSLSFFCFPTTHSVALNGQSSGWRLSVLMESTTEITHRQKNAMQRLNQHIFGCNLKWYTWILRLTNVGCKNVSYHSREGQLNWKKKYKISHSHCWYSKGEVWGSEKNLYSPPFCSIGPMLQLSPAVFKPKNWVITWPLINQFSVRSERWQSVATLLCPSSFHWSTRLGRKQEQLA